MELPADFVVRAAADGDWDAVADVWHDSAIAMDGRPDVPSPTELRSRLVAELESGWDLYVALRGQRIIGLLALKPADATLDQIFVLPSEQGKGVGRALLTVAKQMMPSGFTLRMAAANESARRFYQKQGLKLIGDGFHPWSGVPVQFLGWNGP